MMYLIFIVAAMLVYYSLSPVGRLIASLIGLAILVPLLLWLGVTLGGFEILFDAAKMIGSALVGLVS